MASLNKVILIGNLTSDPELKQTNTGVSVTSFSLAVQRRFANKNEQAQSVDFINAVAWRHTAEFVCRFFKKGRPICIVGSLQSRSWSANDGSKRYTTEVLVDEAMFIDKKSDADAYEKQEDANYLPDAYKESAAFEEASTDDNLPF